MTSQITIEIESSRYSPDSYWLPGAEYYAEKVTLLVADDFDDEAYTDEELLEMADSESDERVRYESEANGNCPNFLQGDANEYRQSDNW